MQIGRGIIFSKSSQNMNTFGTFGTFGFKISFVAGFKRRVIVQQTEKKSSDLAFNPDVIGSIKPLTAHKFRKLKNSPTQKRIVWADLCFHTWTRICQLRQQRLDLTTLG